MNTPLQETLRAAANTGGARVIGVQMIGTARDTELSAILPEDWGGKRFCVRTGSSDGLYDSENVYRAPINTLDPVVIPHVARSEHSDRLQALETEGFGVQVLLDDCANVDRDTGRALAIWRAAEATPSFMIFVNSFDATRLVAFPPDDAPPVECKPIASAISVAYDMACQIEFDPADREMTVELLPVKNGLAGRSEFVTLVFK